MTSTENQKPRITLDDLPELKKMLDDGIITQEDFDKAKALVLSTIGTASNTKKPVEPAIENKPRALTLPEIIDHAEKERITFSSGSASPKITFPKNTLKKVGAAAAICLIIAGAYFYSNSAPHNLNNKRSNAAHVDTQSKGNKNPISVPGPNSASVADVPKAKSPGTYGVITGNDVIMRSAPSTAGQQIGLFSKNKEVNILGKYTCDDPNAAILDTGGITAVLLNGKHVNLEKGLALQILGRTANGGYKCKFVVTGREVSMDFSENEIRRLYGEEWYQVEVDGKTGYVFGSYVQILQVQ